MDTAPVSCVRLATLVEPAALIVFAEFDGHSAMRPRPGLSTLSVRSSGLSQISVSSRLSNHEP